MSLGGCMGRAAAGAEQHNRGESGLTRAAAAAAAAAAHPAGRPRAPGAPPVKPLIPARSGAERGGPQNRQGSGGLFDRLHCCSGLTERSSGTGDG